MFNKSKTFFVLMLLGSSFWCFYIGNVAIEGIKAKEWPSVDGVITFSDAKRADGNKERYIIIVEYKYSVDRTNFTGNKISNLNTLLTRSEKEVRLREYSLNSRVKVYYDPNNHQHSFLTTGVHFITFILWLASLFMVIFSVVHLKKLLKT